MTWRCCKTCHRFLNYRENCRARSSTADLGTPATLSEGTSISPSPSSTCKIIRIDYTRSMPGDTRPVLTFEAVALSSVLGQRCADSDKQYLWKVSSNSEGIKRFQAVGDLASIWTRISAGDYSIGQAAVIESFVLNRRQRTEWKTVHWERNCSERTCAENYSFRSTIRSERKVDLVRASMEGWWLTVCTCFTVKTTIQLNKNENKEWYSGWSVDKQVRKILCSDTSHRDAVCKICRIVFYCHLWTINKRSLIDSSLYYRNCTVWSMNRLSQNLDWFFTNVPAIFLPLKILC